MSFGGDVGGSETNADYHYYGCLIFYPTVNYLSYSSVFFQLDFVHIDETNSMTSICPKQTQPSRTQCELYSTGSRLVHEVFRYKHVGLRFGGI